MYLNFISDFTITKENEINSEYHFDAACYLKIHVVG